MKTLLLLSEIRWDLYDPPTADDPDVIQGLLMWLGIIIFFLYLKFKYKSKH